MRRAVLVFATLVACDHHTAAPPAPATSASIAATPVASAAALGGGTPCGELSCTQFDSPRDAMRAALAGDARVVAIGEAHAPKGATATSAAKRFTDELLPLFAGRASDLLVELMMPPKGCADAAAE
ncbi:MAG TPA: hypothetical protein VIJ22_14385, partial [Polyangiaceae bacterium]